MVNSPISQADYQALAEKSGKYCCLTRLAVHFTNKIKISVLLL